MKTMRHNLNLAATAFCAFALAGGRPTPANAQARAVVVGESFLGIRLDKDRFSDVMRRYGAPHEIQAGGPRLTPSMIPTNPPAGGGSPGAPGGLPGFPGGSPGGAPGGGPGGFGSGSRGSSPSSGDDKILYTELKQTTWWYHFPRKNKPAYHYAFTFDKDGRVSQIQEYGFHDGGRTKDGVGLGSSLGDVLRTYGFSNDGERGENDKLTLRYGNSNRMAFQLTNNTVLGITLARIR